MKIEFEVSNSELLDVNPYPVPFIVAMRNLLESKGMKFEDSGKLSSVVNLDPKPLGYVRRWENVETGAISYLQIIED